MPKYAVRRECHFDCGRINSEFGGEPAFVDTLDDKTIIRAIRQEESCCNRKDQHGNPDLQRIFPPKTTLFVYELENEEVEGTEFLVKKITVPTYQVISGRIYDPEMAEDFAQRVGADCVYCDNQGKDSMDVTPIGLIDSFIGGDLHVHVRCNNCGKMGDPGDGEYWEYHDDIEEVDE